MSTITEDYISFETAKLLKEKWFKFIEDKDELSRAYIHAYTKESEEVWGCYSPDYYPCITINMAMKWLREVHNIHIETRYSFVGEDEYGYKFKIIKIGEDDIGIWSLNDELYSSYEDACEAAIKYCLENLI